jgi:hypothetical protein
MSLPIQFIIGVNRRKWLPVPVQYYCINNNITVQSKLINWFWKVDKIVFSFHLKSVFLCLVIISAYVKINSILNFRRELTFNINMLRQRIIVLKIKCFSTMQYCNKFFSIKVCGTCATVSQHMLLMVNANVIPTRFPRLTMVTWDQYTVLAILLPPSYSV